MVTNPDHPTYLGTQAFTNNTVELTALGKTLRNLIAQADTLPSRRDIIRPDSKLAAACAMGTITPARNRELAAKVHRLYTILSKNAHHVETRARTQRSQAARSREPGACAADTPSRRRPRGRSSPRSRSATNSYTPADSSKRSCCDDVCLPTLSQPLQLQGPLSPTRIDLHQDSRAHPLFQLGHLSV